jgi:hypothetical protein
VVAIVLLLACVIQVATRALNRRPFAPDTVPEGAYARIALAVAERRTRDAFAYLETEAQWASYTVRDARKKGCERARKSYPFDERKKILAAWKDDCDAVDGADVFEKIALRRGWTARLERDLSGVAHVEIQGERATVVTGRGTRYPFRRRDNGIWGLTIFTAELQAEAERASRDLEMVERAALDYERAAVP